MANNGSRYRGQVQLKVEMREPRYQQEEEWRRLKKKKKEKENYNQRVIEAHLWRREGILTQQHKQSSVGWLQSWLVVNTSQNWIRTELCCFSQNGIAHWYFWGVLSPSMLSKLTSYVIAWLAYSFLKDTHHMRRSPAAASTKSLATADVTGYRWEVMRMPKGRLITTMPHLFIFEMA